MVFANKKQYKEHNNYYNFIVFSKMVGKLVALIGQGAFNRDFTVKVDTTIMSIVYNFEFISTHLKKHTGKKMYVEM